MLYNSLYKNTTEKDGNMKIFNQLGIILGIFAMGEIISSLFSSVIKIPGAIMGMILLFLLLQFKVIKEEKIKDVADFLLNNMAIFFVPAGVSLINSLGLIGDNILVLVLTSTIATIIVMLATGMTVEFMINKKSLKSHEDDVEDEDGIPAVISDDKLSSTIVDALGGKINIVSIENCMTRLRVVVDNPNLINEKVLKDTGASGFVRPTKENIQIVYGLKVDQIASDVKAYLKSI